MVNCWKCSMQAFPIRLNILEMLEAEADATAVRMQWLASKSVPGNAISTASLVFAFSST